MCKKTLKEAQLAACFMFKAAVRWYFLKWHCELVVNSEKDT